MNARLPRGPITPRDGKPVELNALWANALGAVGALRERCGRDASVVHARRDAVKAQVVKRFRAPDGWLFDIVDAQPAAYPKGGGSIHDDAVLRPNQLLAFSLPYAPGADEAHLRSRVLQAVGSALLTPLGLRSLAPAEYGYHGRHRGRGGRQGHRVPPGDRVAWWLGPYVEARLAAGLPVDTALTAVEAHLGECGLGSVSEIAEGDAPHRPTGRPVLRPFGRRGAPREGRDQGEPQVANRIFREERKDEIGPRCRSAQAPERATVTVGDERYPLCAY